MRRTAIDRCAPAALLLALATVQAPAKTVTIEDPDQVTDVACRVRYTCTITLDPDERILDWVAGDTESWQVTGAANITYIKPVAEDVETNVTLVTESGRLYFFLAAEVGDAAIDIHTGVTRPRPEEVEEAAPPPPPHHPRFISRDEVDEYAAAAEAANRSAAEAWEQADASIAAAVDEFRAQYPTLMRFEFRLDRSAASDPFHIEGMWHDGRFTFVRSSAQETPALYEERDGKPSLVNYDLRPDGLMIVGRVLADGWFQIGRKRARWTRLVARQPPVGPPPPPASTTPPQPSAALEPDAAVTDGEEPSVQ